MEEKDLANKSIRFKNPENVINYNGVQIGSWNLTKELYLMLVNAAPAHADLFLVEDLPKDKKPAEKVS